MKPNWSDSPSWAEYLAMDYDGVWYWYKEKPTLSVSRWKSTDHWIRHAEVITQDWRDTLEERPVHNEHEAEGKENEI
jgi:hypothetical protein